MKNDFEGFLLEDIIKGRQKLIHKHICGLPLPWPVYLKNTNVIMDCVISSIEKSMSNSESDST